MSKVEDQRLAILTLDAGTLDRRPGRDMLFYREKPGETLGRTEAPDS
jgi:hypothetical protein